MSSPYNLRSRKKIQEESPTSTSIVDQFDDAKTSKVTVVEGRELGKRDWLGVTAIVVFIILLTSYCNGRLPTPLEPNAANDRFSALRARPFLERVTALGPRVSGSEENEVHARRLILDELHAIQDATASSHHRMEIQEQKSSGCYDIPRFDIDGFTVCYKNVSNIIVRLGDKKRDWKQSQTSVLVNCHYDTWPSSPGRIHLFLLLS